MSQIRRRRADHVPRGDSERGQRQEPVWGGAESGREWPAVTARQLSAVRSMEAEAAVIMQ